MSYERAWFGEVIGLRSLYVVRRAGRFIGFVARWGRYWLAGLPDGYGTWVLNPVTDLPIQHYRREDAALRLAMIAEGIPTDG